MILSRFNDNCKNDRDRDRDHDNENEIDYMIDD